MPSVSVTIPVSFIQHSSFPPSTNLFSMLRSKYTSKSMKFFRSVFHSKKSVSIPSSAAPTLSQPSVLPPLNNNMTNDVIRDPVRVSSWVFNRIVKMIPVGLGLFGGLHAFYQIYQSFNVQPVEILKLFEDIEMAPCCY